MRAHCSPKRTPSQRRERRKFQSRVSWYSREFSPSNRRPARDMFAVMQLHRKSLTAYGAPLCETIVDLPRPQGSEVLVRIDRCGVCHSDLPMPAGYFHLGGDKKLDVRAGRTLPFALGHEIAGVVENVGPLAAAKP